MAARPLFGIVLLLVTFVAVNGECLNGFTKHGNSCYKIEHDKEHWSQATVECKEMNAHLVEFDDADEERFVHGLLTLHWRAYDPPEFWIGGNDIMEEGKWQWLSGNPVSYNNWDDGQPDNGGDNDHNEHCMEIKQEDGWKWNDQECDEKRYFICEMP